MRAISPRVKEILDSEPEVCALRHTGACGGRITREHAVIFKGQQLNEAWAIIKICARHHSVDEYQDGGLLDKEVNLWVAVNRATDAELTAVTKAIDYHREKRRLNEKYGSYPLNNW